MNDIGKKYDSEEQDVIYQLSTYLKNRDREHNPRCLEGIRPRDYMLYYTKAAAALIELSKNLATHPGPKQKTPAEWARILTGFTLTKGEFNASKTIMQIEPTLVGHNTQKRIPNCE